MKQILIDFSVAFLLIAWPGSSYAAPGNNAIKTTLTAGDLLFTENKGQVCDNKGHLQQDVLFTARSGNACIFLTATGIDYQFTHIEYTKGGGSAGPLALSTIVPGNRNQTVKTSTCRFTVLLAGANAHAVIRKEEKSRYTENFYLPHCPKGITGVATYKRIVYENIYPGIDWEICSHESSLKYNFIVHPGANPNVIRLQVRDAKGYTVLPAGNLQIETALGTVTEAPPVSFCGRNKVATRFISTGKDIGFVTGDYDSSLPLVIDPSVSWATYFGGPGQDMFTDCITDNSGNVYASGFTMADDLAMNGFQTTYGGTVDAMLIKFDTAGTRLWATYYGGAEQDGYPKVKCAADRHNNVCMCLSTSTYTGLDYQGAQDTFSSTGGGMLVKFDSTGARLWATYYPVSQANGCATDKWDNVYLSGVTYNATGVGTAGTYSTTAFGNGDAFLAKFTSSGNRLWGTIFGGSELDEAYDCKADDRGNVYIAGETRSPDHIGYNGYQNVFMNGISDNFFARFDSSGHLLQSTYFGGPGLEDGGNSCSLDSQGNLYMTGTTGSATGIATPGAFQTVNTANNLNGNLTGYLAKFDTAGALLWATYYGSDSLERSWGCAADRYGNVYTAGITTSVTGLGYHGFQNTGGGSADFTIAKFNAAGQRVWGSYYGGPQAEGAFGSGCAVDKKGHVYMAGYARTAGLATPGALQTTLTPNDIYGDAFIAQVTDTNGIYVPGSIAAVCPGTTFLLPYTATGQFGDSNVFTAQLSNVIGNFTAPITVGSIAGTTSGNIPVTIPTAGVSGGSGYRIRIVSSAPGFTGTPGNTFIIYPTYNNVSTQTLCAGDSIVVGDSIYKTSGVHTQHFNTVHGCDSVFSLHVTVVPLPNPVISFANPVLSISGGGIIQWYLNGNPISGATGTSYTAITNGSYSVNVTNNHGCTGSASYMVANLGISAGTATAAIKVYPNPAKEIIYISAPFPVRAQLKTITGSLLLQCDNCTHMDIKSFAAGTYLLELANDSGAIIKTQKIQLD